jgi:hypothetical protein
MKPIKGTGSREENETVVIFNEASQDAIITTASPGFFNRLIRAGWTPEEDGLFARNTCRARFIIPKRKVSLRSAKTRTLTEDQKKKRTEALQNARITREALSNSSPAGKTTPKP